LDDAVYFRAPVDWVVTDEDGTGIAIFADRPGSGTLRPWTEIYDFDDMHGRDAAAEQLHDSVPCERLGERTTLSYTVIDRQENGEEIRLHKWLVAIQVGERRLRVVTFIHTVEAEQEGSEETEGELLAVELAVRGALFPDAVAESLGDTELNQLDIRAPKCAKST
jgi:hypothetical protein